MTTHLERDLALLKDGLLVQGKLVERALDLATRALVQQSPDLALRVIEADVDIDTRELALDEESLKILALYQPVAGDLRFITACMKINSDLERIGDLAVNIAERALDLSSRPQLDEPMHFEQMTEVSRWMLRSSLQALVQGDAELAREMCARDDEVDDFNRRHFETLIRRMREDPDQVDACLDYLTISLHLERIADHATNIGEDVVFMVEAVDIRHLKAKARTG